MVISQVRRKPSLFPVITEMCRFKSLDDLGFQQAWIAIKGIINNRQELKSLSALGEMPDAKLQRLNLGGHEPTVPLFQRTKRFYTYEGTSQLFRCEVLSSIFADLRRRIPCLP